MTIWVLCKALVGNILIDSLEMITLAIQTETIQKDMGLADKTYGVVTLHRSSNVDIPDVLSRLCRTIVRISERIVEIHSSQTNQRPLWLCEL